MEPTVTTGTGSTIQPKRSVAQLLDAVPKQSGRRMVAVFRGSYVYEPVDSACRSVVGEGPVMGELIEVVVSDTK
jgi:hypothetical protein